MTSWQLFAVTVLVWGTTWHAIVYQLAHTSPEVGVTLRFALAGAAVLIFLTLRGQHWRISPAQHARAAFQGIFMYSVSYLCVYHAERHVPSGLVAVGYSAAPLVNGVASHLLWGTPLTRRFLLGGLSGLLGVVLIFWPELAGMMHGGAPVLGAAFTVGAVLLSSVGALAASRNASVGLSLWPAMGWGMLYSAACSGAFALAAGHSFVLPSATNWWLSLAYLSFFGSVVAFACFLQLQQRWGPGQASMVGVATPVLALGVSTLLEGYRPGVLALLGITLAAAGNLLALRPAVKPANPPAPG